MSKRIDHAAKSEGIVERAVSWFGEKMITESNLVAKMAIAQVHATLALVEQQRIANMIALGQLQILSGMDGKGVIVGDGAPFRRLYPDGERTPLAQDIAAALGIGDDDE